MSTSPKLAAKIILAIFLAAQFTGFFFLFPKELESANLTSVSDTLSNNRLSFRGEISGSMAAGATVLTLKTTGLAGNDTSTGSAALMGNDPIRVGLAGSTATVTTVKVIDTATRIVLAAGLSNALSDGDTVISTVSAIHTAKFTPVSTIANGAFRVLMPASATQSASGDGLPDKDGFELDSNALPTVACSGGGSNITFSGSYSSASVSAILVGSTRYHSFECRYSGSGASPTAVTMTVGTAAGNKVINPSPASVTRYPGGADTYTFRTRHLYGIDQSYATLDETFGAVGVVEAVRVTATVQPVLTFQISGRSGTSCGQSASATSTYNSVPFGNLTANALTNNMAQLLVVSTNAAGGYTVTASESGVLTALNVSGTPTIVNTTCGGSCTVTTAAEWNTATQTGLGYSLEDVAGDSVAATLEYNYSSRTFNARPFGSTGESIMSGSGTTDSDQAYACYRIIISGSQTAGDYENYVIYIATATF